VQKIFLSYRRDDAGGQALLLSRLLREQLRNDLVFMDIDNIPFGIDFVEHIKDEVGRCDVLLAVIGNQWLQAQDEQGNRRIDDPNDFVRLEISTALRRDIPVVPVLLDGTKMPREDRLPEDLKRFSYRSGINVHHTSFESDVSRLVHGLKRSSTNANVTDILPASPATWRRAAIASFAALVIIAASGWIWSHTDSKLAEESSALWKNFIILPWSASSEVKHATQNSATPDTEQLKSYVVALQDARADAATKTGVLKKILSLTESQVQSFVALSPITDCRGDKYAEPVALTLIDLTRSNDRQMSTLAQQAIDKLQAKLLFGDFVLKQPSECRGEWVFRLEVTQAKELVDTLKSKGVPLAELESFDINTPDNWRTIIRPTTTSEGDLYQVAAKIPSDDTKLKCLASVYRSQFVNMQDGTQNAADPIQKEFELLKSLANGPPRKVGWYYKLFQRDLLAGAHQCKVEAVATQSRG
jgi:TIR domain